MIRKQKLPLHNELLNIVEGEIILYTYRIHLPDRDKLTLN